MEKYININNIIENDIFKLYKDSVICPLCHNILINPIMCMKCDGTFCKKCIDDWEKKNLKCPNNCNEPNYQQNSIKNDILYKLKFKCEECEEEIYYNEMKNHIDKCTHIKDLSQINIKKNRGMKRITKEEVQILKKEGNEIKYMTSKNINIEYYFIILI